MDNTAEWITNGGGRIMCSNCHNFPLYDYFGKLKLSKHCPNCGKEMKREGKHNG